MTDEEAWVRFAAAVLDGMNAVCDRDGMGGYKSNECVRTATHQADALLAEFRTRFPAKGAAT